MEFLCKEQAVEQEILDKITSASNYWSKFIQGTKERLEKKEIKVTPDLRVQTAEIARSSPH